MKIKYTYTLKEFDKVRKSEKKNEVLINYI